MIAIGEYQALWQGMHSAVFEREQRPAKAKCSEHGIMRNGAKRQDRPQAGHNPDLRGEKPAAARDFARLRLVQRRNAAHGIGDAHPPELKAVIRVGVVGAFGEAKLAQRLVEEPAGIVAGEWAPGAVCATQTWRKSDDEQLGLPVTERRHRPIEPFRMGLLLDRPESREA